MMPALPSPVSPTVIRDRLQALARDQLGWVRPLPDGDLSEQLDSVDRLALVVAIEDHFHILFEPDDEAAVRTLDDVVAFIQRALDAEPTAS